MTDPKIIHVERIVHDPLLGEVRGVAIRREPDGGLTRHRVSAQVDRPALAHAEAAGRLRQQARSL